MRTRGAADLRRAAIGRECTIRLPGICIATPCCLAHWRQSDFSGMGMKSPDIFGAWACGACHTAVDTADRDDAQLRLDFAKGVFRTQNTLIREGVVTW